MKSRELRKIIEWIINRKCKKNDNIHIKRAVRESKSVMKITGWTQENLIDKIVTDLISFAKVYIDKIDNKFAYTASIIYKTSLPHLLDNHMQKYIKQSEEDFINE